MRNINRLGFTLFELIYVIMTLFTLAVGIALIIVAAHFIIKFW